MKSAHIGAPARAWVAATALCLAGVAPACALDSANSASPSGPGAPGDTSSGSAASDPEGTGTVGAQLTLPAGQQIEVVQWIITGPSGASNVVQTGSVGVPGTNAVSFVASAIPSGSGYRITLTGTSIDGSVVCTGAASFAISSRETTPVSVAMACSPATSGSQVTLVNGDSFNCAALTNVTASPLKTQVGGTITLSSSATGPIPANLSYNWQAPSGSFDNPNGADAHFTCANAGLVPITVSVADGPVPAGAACNGPLGTRTVDVVCDALDAGPPPPPQVPALPPWGMVAGGLAFLGLGWFAARRRRMTEVRSGALR